MSTDNATITRKVNDSHPVKITVIDKDTGEVIPLTTEGFVLSVSPELDPDQTTVSFTSDGTITDGPNGKVSFPIDSADVAVRGEYYYDVVMTNTDSTTRTILEGSFILEQRIGQ